MDSQSYSISKNCIAQQCLLRERQLSFDPQIQHQSFRKRLYSQPSFVKRFEIEKRLKNHNGCVNCINFSETGNLLASGSDDLQIVLWDWAKGSPVSSFNSKHVANVFQVRMIVWSRIHVHTCVMILFTLFIYKYNVAIPLFSLPQTLKSAL